MITQEEQERFEKLKAFKEYTPSEMRPILKTLIGKKITHMIRYSWWPAKESVQPYIEAPTLVENAVFSYTAGPLFIKFDKGIGLGFGDQPSSNSVTMWIEEDEKGEILSSLPLALARDVYPIDSIDKVYADKFWNNITNTQVTGISILTEAFPTGKRIGLANEVGLLFTLDTKEKFVVSRNLCDSPDDFAVIAASKIKTSLIPLLKKYACKYFDAIVSTSYIKIFTDRAGNLITAYPVRGGN